MCFSAQASFTAAAVLSGIGIVTRIQARNKDIKLFATGPLLFGIQQAIEGVVWLTLNNGDTTSMIHKAAVYGFIFFAACLWPVLTPYATYRIEPDSQRKRVLLWFLSIGIVSAALSAYAWITYGIFAHSVDHHIAYSFVDSSVSKAALWAMKFIGLSIYLTATAGSLFISSVPCVWILGLLLVISFIITQLFYKLAFGSVWCFFGAIMSLFVYYVVREYNKRIDSHRT